MTTSLLVLLLAAAVVWYLWYRERAKSRTSRRLAEMIAVHSGEDENPEVGGLFRAFPPRYRIAPPIAGLAAALGLAIAGMPLEVAVAGGALAGVLAHLLESFVAEQQTLKIELQLVEAIDLLVASLRAGASLLAAFESALREAREPLRFYFHEIAGRIRLGGDPQTVVGELPLQVPLETFRLFAAALAVHWEVGGSLATTLSTVGRTIRDRIELSRRVRAQAIEAHVSVGVVMIIAYVLGYLMWRTNPDRLEAFARTDVGAELIAAAIVLQAVGLVWMSQMSRSDF